MVDNILNDEFYVNMSLGILREIIVEYPIAVEVFMYMVDSMDKDNVIMVSQSTIAENIGRTRQSVSKGLDVLRKYNVISIDMIDNKRTYTLNKEVVYI